jgi:regulator of protease activity HflC (stomatin/prohibitin superfamily)
MANNLKIGAIVVGSLLVLGAVATPFFIKQIKAGYVGVVYKPDGGIQKETLPQGWNKVGPFDRITEYPVKRRTVPYQNIVVPTSDGKNVTIDFTINYHIAPEKVTHVFNTFGPIDIEQIETGYLKSRLAASARKSISKFTVIQLYGESSSDASTRTFEELRDDVAKDGFIIEDITLGAPQPDAKTQEAIDARVKAQQELERMNTELQIATKEAERKRTEARGTADANLIEAEGKAKSNNVLQQSLTPELIEYVKAQKWNGELPTTQVNGGANTLLNLK